MKKAADGRKGLFGQVVPEGLSPPWLARKARYQKHEASLMHASAVKKRVNGEQEQQRCTPHVCLTFPHSTTTIWGPSVQTHELMQVISSLSHQWDNLSLWQGIQGSKEKECWATKVRALQGLGQKEVAPLLLLSRVLKFHALPTSV